MTDVRRQKSEVSKGTALSAMLSALCLLGAILLATSYLAEAQQPKTKVPEIGVFFPGSPSAYASYVEAFRQGLQELAYIVGQSILIEYRYAEGKPDRLTEFAAE